MLNVGMNRDVFVLDSAVSKKFQYAVFALMYFAFLNGKLPHRDHKDTVL